MGVAKLKSKTKSKAKTSSKEKSLEQRSSMPIIATARPGLSDIKSALIRRLPSNYIEKNVRDVLGYMVDSEINDSEASTVKSLKNELGAAGSVVVINGQEVKLTDPVRKYVVNGTKDVGDREIQYHQLDIEVSAVQQGGYGLCSLL